MKHKHLITTCISLYKSYNPSTQTLDSYLTSTLGSCDSPSSPPDNQFIKQVLYTCLRWSKGIKGFLRVFFEECSGRVLRGDYGMYVVMVCLAVFKIEELGIDEFAKFSNTQEPTKICTFLTYIFDTSPSSPLQTTVKQEWCKHYDITYVENELIGRISRFAPQMNALCSALNDKAKGLVKMKEEKDKASGVPQVTRKMATVPKGPNITAPRPRRVPEPMKISSDVRVGAEPTYLDRTSLAEIQKEKDERLFTTKESTRKKYEDCRERPFKLHKTKLNIVEIRRKVEERREAELQFDSRHSKPLPDFTKRNATVKLNTAAILREDALFKKKQAEEAALLQSYERDLRDSTEFYRWKTEMSEHDNKMKLEQVKLKRMQAECSTQNARDALERQFYDNKAVADLIKEEGELLVRQRMLEDNVAIMLNKQLVREVKEVESKAPRQAEAKVFRERQQVRLEQKIGLKAAWERKIVEDEVEQERKMDKIRQLRTHTVHKPEVKVFDPTTSAGLGLLDEMSLVEMEERLQIRKIREENDETEKRRSIMSERSRKQVQLAQRLENIQRIREAARISNKDARLQKEVDEAAKVEREQIERELAQSELADHLTANREARRKEISSLQEEEERRKKNQMFQGAAAHQVEEAHFDQLLLGAERESRTRQIKAQEAAVIYEQTKAVARRVVEKEAKQKQTSKKALYAAKDAEIKESLKDLVEKEKAETAMKKNGFMRTRMKEVELKAKTIDRNVYASGINTMSLNLASTTAAARTQQRNALAELTAM